jgi:anti-anti-sigma factor
MGTGPQTTRRGRLALGGKACLSDLRRQTRPCSVADLTGLAFIDCVCLTVLVRHCKDTRSRGASFALAGPHGAVHRILAVTGLLTWFEVYDTVEEAVSRTHIAMARLARNPGRGVTPRPPPVGLTRGARTHEKPCRALAARHASVQESGVAARAASHSPASRASSTAALPPTGRRTIIGHPSHCCAGRKETPL